MSNAMAIDTAHPVGTTVRSAHVLAGLLVVQGVAALGSLAFLMGVEGRGLDGFVTQLLALTVLLSFAGAGLAWGRARFAEMVAAAALLASFGLTLALVLTGLWYLVPFVGLATIIAIFGLVDRFAADDEAGHQPKPKH